MAETIELKLTITRKRTEFGTHIIADSVALGREDNIRRTRERVVPRGEFVEQALSNAVWDVIADELRRLD